MTQKITESKTSLTPHGVSGLKFLKPLPKLVRFSSHPAWGEWIEIDLGQFVPQRILGLTPHGVSGLKSAHHSTM